MRCLGVADDILRRLCEMGQGMSGEIGIVIVVGGMVNGERWLVISEWWMRLVCGW